MAEDATLACDAVSLRLDLSTGHLADVRFTDGGRSIAPLHQAPWAVDELPESVPMVLRRLSGDFFCAPFCAPDIEPAPWHGWSANSAWRPLAPEPTGDDGTCHRFELERPILGARLEKRIRLIDRHPIVYQRHIFHGGSGALPVAHHLMLRTDRGLKLSFSAKRFGLTPAQSATAQGGGGTSVLAYPQRFADLTRVAAASGGVIDASRHPYADATEDHIYLFDPSGARLAWSAAVCAEEGYAVFAVKDAAVLPATLLWISHYGLLDPPFSGRHGDCLGLEEICSNLALGHQASIEPNALSDQSIATALTLDPLGSTAVDYAFGCIGIDDDWREIADISVIGDSLVISDVGGGRRVLPYAHGIQPCM